MQENVPKCAGLRESESDTERLKESKDECNGKWDNLTSDAVRF